MTTANSKNSKNNNNREFRFTNFFEVSLIFLVDASMEKKEKEKDSNKCMLQSVLLLSLLLFVECLILFSTTLKPTRITLAALYPDLPDKYLV